MSAWTFNNVTFQRRDPPSSWTTADLADLEYGTPLEMRASFDLVDAPPGSPIEVGEIRFQFWFAGFWREFADAKLVEPFTQPTGGGPGTTGDFPERDLLGQSIAAPGTVRTRACVLWVDGEHYSDEILVTWILTTPVAVNSTQTPEATFSETTFTTRDVDKSQDGIALLNDPLTDIPANEVVAVIPDYQPTTRDIERTQSAGVPELG